MRILDFVRERAKPINLFDAAGAANLYIGSGHGDAHVYALYFTPGGAIGPHPAGYAQFFLVVEGEGWVAGPDGVRTVVTAGQGAYFAPGEVHSKGSESGMSVLMVQADTLEPAEHDVPTE